jgi:hypothetical protein
MMQASESSWTGCTPSGIRQGLEVATQRWQTVSPNGDKHLKAWGFVFRAFVGAVLFAAWLSEVAFALVAGYRVSSAMGKSQHVLETKLTHQL